MATLFDRITGKTENELTAKIEELEKELTAAQEKIVSLEEQVASLDEAKREVFNLTKTIHENDKTIATLEDSNRGFSQKIAELNEKHTAVVTEATNLKKRLSESEEAKLVFEAKLASTEAKLASTETKLEETKRELESSWRSLELGKIAEDGVLPGKEEIEKLRTDVYTEYFNAQDHIISDLIRSNCSFDGTMQLDISHNESFMLHAGNSYRLFVCTKLIEKLCVGKDGYWDVIVHFNKMTENLTDIVCRLRGGYPKNISVQVFPSPKYISPIYDEQRIVQISPIGDTYPEVFLEVKYHPHCSFN